MEQSASVYLNTPRLVLRRFTEADAPLLFELDSDPEVTRWVNGGQPPNMDYIRSTMLPRIFIQYERFPGLGFFAAEERATSRFIGWFHFRPKLNEPGTVELGYRLMRSAWGKGYASEGSRALLENGFRNLAVDTVEASALLPNMASIRVMEKLGMTFVGQYWEEHFPGPQKDAVLYRINKDEYKQQHPDL